MFEKPYRLARYNLKSIFQNGKSSYGLAYILMSLAEQLNSVASIRDRMQRLNADADLNISSFP
ncbi:hypothetical protein [Acetobacter senegalensis]|uniref:hypothetical protein n=1 Tax=Acetobacter senegalensis TaxID=446692 RepID=UPI00264A8A37|nr:hypothetical protein [Acetobacter senegalensis]MDN7354725.1 hypothetical protein [Acetobacter senegalensis]